MKRIITSSLFLLCFILILAAWQTAQAKAELQQAGASTKTPTATPITPTATATPSPVPSLTPTTTLMPLPAITLIFPADTETSTPTDTPIPAEVFQTPIPDNGGSVFSLSPRIKLLVALIVVLWLFLIGFAVIYIRQFK